MAKHEYTLTDEQEAVLAYLAAERNANRRPEDLLEEITVDHVIQQIVNDVFIQIGHDVTAMKRAKLIQDIQSGKRDDLLAEVVN